MPKIIPTLWVRGLFIMTGDKEREMSTVFDVKNEILPVMINSVSLT